MINRWLPSDPRWKDMTPECRMEFMMWVGIEAQEREERKKQEQERERKK